MFTKLPQTNLRIFISTVVFFAGEINVAVNFSTRFSKNYIMQCLLTLAAKRSKGESFAKQQYLGFVAVKGMLGGGDFIISLLIVHRYTISMNQKE